MTETVRVDPALPDGEAIARAAECLRRGGLVAFPTETVYGLGAHALDREAIRKLFEAKGRPAHDPLIVHVPALEDARDLVRDVPAAAARLADRFWPGPLTLVLRRGAAVPPEVVAGLDSVAIRVPAHPVARALLAAARIPVAAPSANLFSRPSPTCAAHVLADLDGRIDMVIDGGRTNAGIESTVVDLTRDPPVVLRPGVVSLEAIRALVPGTTLRPFAADSTAAALPSPGLLPRHYSPRTPLTLFEGSPAAITRAMESAIREAATAGRRVGVVATGDQIAALEPVAVPLADLGPSGDAPAVAGRLYAALREIDALGLDAILAGDFPHDDGLGRAVRDRLRRAAARRIAVPESQRRVPARGVAAPPQRPGTRLASAGRMPNTPTALATPLRAQLDRLAAFEPVDSPVLSLYLDMRPDQHGRDNYDTFLRKAFADRGRALEGDARKSFQRDAERINQYLSSHAEASTNGLALFACAAADDFFEALQLNAPIEHHWLFVGAVPHLYPLARVTDQYPRYAAVVADTNTARLFVFSLGRPERQERVENVKTRKHAMGGWSQARYQRHVENFHLQHAKDVVAMLDRVVREEEIPHVVLACDEVARPLLLEQMPEHLARRIVDVVSLDIDAPEHVILKETLDILRQRDDESDAARVEALLGAWRAGGLAVVGPEDTLQALAIGQVDEILIAGAPESLRRPEVRPPDAAPGEVELQTSSPDTGLDQDQVRLAGELVARAHQSGARLRFIENGDLLADVGGVGAFLRYRL